MVVLVVGEGRAGFRSVKWFIGSFFFNSGKETRVSVCKKTHETG